jgi:hypothetical protein
LAIGDRSSASVIAFNLQSPISNQQSPILPAFMNPRLRFFGVAAYELIHANGRRKLVNPVVKDEYKFLTEPDS